MTFPIIKTMDCVLDEFEARPEFAIMDRGDYFVIDYVYADSDTFATPVLKEGRGLKFGRDGTLIGRPFHKFFNLGEKPETMIGALDWTSRIDVETKHDGSMIHPVRIGKDILLMTRKGHTDVARQCEAECDVPWDEMVDYLNRGITPIYEFTSPNNQIVVPYEKAEMRLLAARDMITGVYVPIYNRNLRQSFIDGDFVLDSFIEEVRGLKGEEGVVLVWPNGHRVKMKADEYVSLHRNIDLAASESRLLEVILNGNVDDLLPLLPEARAQAVREFSGAVMQNVAMQADLMNRFVHAREGLSQKDYAFQVNGYVIPPLRSAYFKFRQGGNATEVMIDRYRQLLRKQKDVEEYRGVLLNGAELNRGGL